MKRVGIIGCGNIAQVHAEVLKNMAGLELSAFADCRIEKAKEYAEKYGVQNSGYYVSLEEMLSNETLDVIHICSPHFLHVPMAEYALKCGVHVFMEKPPAITREQFEHLQNAEKFFGKRVGICFQNRYNEATLIVQKLLEEQKLGTLIGARAFVTWNREEEYYTQSGWRGKKAFEGGGVLINQAIHILDLLVRFLGKPKSVAAGISNHRLKECIEVEDTVQAYIEFEDVAACFYATNAYAVDAPVMLELVGEKGVVRIEGQELTVRYHDGAAERYLWHNGTDLGKSYWGNSHSGCIADFYHCLEYSTDYGNDLSTTEDTFTLVMDIYEAAGI